MDAQTELSQAQVVIDECGGIGATASLIERDRSVVNKWKMAKEKGGTGGKVPPKHWPTLIKAKPQLLDVLVSVGGT